MKKILILNGSPRKNGKTASLIKASISGAESSGNEVKELYLQKTRTLIGITLTIFQIVLFYTV